MEIWPNMEINSEETHRQRFLNHIQVTVQVCIYTVSTRKKQVGKRVEEVIHQT